MCRSTTDPRGAKRCTGCSHQRRRSRYAENTAYRNKVADDLAQRGHADLADRVRRAPFTALANIAAASGHNPRDFAPSSGRMPGATANHPLDAADRALIDEVGAAMGTGYTYDPASHTVGPGPVGLLAAVGGFDDDVIDAEIGLFRRRATVLDHVDDAPGYHEPDDVTGPLADELEQMYRSHQAGGPGAIYGAGGDPEGRLAVAAEVHAVSVAGSHHADPYAGFRGERGGEQLAELADDPRVADYTGDVNALPAGWARGIGPLSDDEIGYLIAGKLSNTPGGKGFHSRVESAGRCVENLRVDLLRTEKDLRAAGRDDAADQVRDAARDAWYHASASEAARCAGESTFVRTLPLDADAPENPYPNPPVMDKVGTAREVMERSAADLGLIAAARDQGLEGTGSAYSSLHAHRDERAVARGVIERASLPAAHPGDSVAGALTAINQNIGADVAAARFYNAADVSSPWGFHGESNARLVGNELAERARESRNVATALRDGLGDSPSLSVAAAAARTSTPPVAALSVVSPAVADAIIEQRIDHAHRSSDATAPAGELDFARAADHVAAMSSDARANAVSDAAFADRAITSRAGRYTGTRPASITDPADFRADSDPARSAAEATRMASHLIARDAELGTYPGAHTTSASRQDIDRQAAAWKLYADGRRDMVAGRTDTGWGKVMVAVAMTRPDDETYTFDRDRHEQLNRLPIAEYDGMPLFTEEEVEATIAEYGDDYVDYLTDSQRNSFGTYGSYYG